MRSVIASESVNIIDSDFDETNDEIIPITFRQSQNYPPEIMLWVAVIGEVFRQSTKDFEKYITTRDFKVICHLIGINPSYIKHKFETEYRRNTSQFQHRKTTGLH